MNNNQNNSNIPNNTNSQNSFIQNQNNGYPQNNTNPQSSFVQNQNNGYPQNNTNSQSSFVQNKNINIVNSQNNEINDSDKYLTEMKLFAKYTVILFILGQILMIVTTGVANLSDADRAGIFVIFTPDFIIFFIFFLIAGNLQLASFTSFIMTIIYFIKWLIHKRK